jgi:hypothetical protein
LCDALHWIIQLSEFCNGKKKLHYVYNYPRFQVPLIVADKIKFKDNITLAVQQQHLHQLNDDHWVIGTLLGTLKRDSQCSACKVSHGTGLGPLDTVWLKVMVEGRRTWDTSAPDF